MFVSAALIASVVVAGNPNECRYVEVMDCDGHRHFVPAVLWDATLHILDFICLLDTPNCPGGAEPWYFLSICGEEPTWFTPTRTFYWPCGVFEETCIQEPWDADCEYVEIACNHKCE